MKRILSRLFQRESAPRSDIHLFEVVSDPDRLPTRPLSMPLSSRGPLGYMSDPDLIPPPEPDPSILFPVLRYLRDNIPDVSAGVWAWVRLCNTPQTVRLEGGSAHDVSQAREILALLDARIHEFEHAKGQGMESLVAAFFLSIFTYGSFAGEVVLTDDRRAIDKFYIIDPATIRFRRTRYDRHLVPYQLLPDGKTIRLTPGSFFYCGLDAEGDTPYGRSPLLALPLVARVQQQMIVDLARASHNAGFPTLHVKYSPGLARPGESPSAFNERTAREFTEIRDRLRDKKTDSNFITFDNIQVEYIGPGGTRTRWMESLQAVSEQVISALHLAPFMVGRNWGTTESWGTAQYQLLTNHAVTVQESAKRMVEWLRNLELSLHGIPVICHHQFSPHRKLDEFGAARAEALKIKTGLELMDRKILSGEEFAQFYLPKASL
jgi:hypothetical protein